MIVFTAVSTAASAAVNAVYFKTKRDKLFFPIISAVIFSVIISILIFNKLDMLNCVKTFSVLSLLHICSVNDIIRHRSDDIFPIIIIAVGLIKPQNIVYMIFSIAIILIIFLILIITSKKTIGGGDIKMICALTFFFGIETTVVSVIIACISGIVYALISKFAAKLPDFSKRFAFLPFVEAGYIIALLSQLY